MPYINGKVTIGLQKDSFKIRKASHSDEMKELVMDLDTARELFAELNIIFGKNSTNINYNYSSMPTPFNYSPSLPDTGNPPPTYPFVTC